MAIAASPSALVSRQNREFACITMSQAPMSSGERFCERTPSASSSLGSIAATTFLVISSCKREDVGQFAVIAIGPDVVASRGVDQLGGDAHAVAALADAALQHVAHAEFAGDALYVDCLALVGE